MYKHFTRIISFDVGARNLSYSVLSWNRRPAITGNKWTQENVRKEGIHNIMVDEWKCIDILEATNKKRENVYKCNTTMLVNCLIQVLHNEFFQLLTTQPDEVTAVIVEKQPGTSRKIDVIGYSIVAFMSTISMEHGLSLFIETMTAKNKLLLCDLLDVQVTIKTRTKKTEDGKPAKQTKKQQKSQMYRLNKKRAVQGTTDILDIIHMRDELKTNFQKSKKKDDYADNLLQGIYFYLHGQRKSLFPSISSSSSSSSASSSSSSSASSSTSASSSSSSSSNNKGKQKVFMTIDLTDDCHNHDEDEIMRSSCGEE